MAALIQIATTQGWLEKESMNKLEAEEIHEEAERNAALEVSQEVHQQKEAPICKGELCEVNVALRNTDQCHNWNQQTEPFCKICVCLLGNLLLFSDQNS